MTFSALGNDTDGNTITVNQSDRREGTYIIGASGKGKSVLLHNVILQDIVQGIGVIVIDPNRDLITNIIGSLPANKIDETILLDIANFEYPFGLHIYECANPADPKAVQYVVDRVMHIWERLFAISRSTPQMAQYMRNCAHVLIANQGYTMADIPLLFYDKVFRDRLLSNVTNLNVRLFWQNYENMPRLDRSRETSAVINKLDEFMQPMAINVVGQAKSTINLRQIMDDRKILLLQLDPQLQATTSLVGSTLLSMILMAAYSRENLPPNKRKQVNVYIDELDYFATKDVQQIFQECRKYGVSITAAHQSRVRLQTEVPELARGILGAATTVSFQITPPDSNELAGKFDTTPPMPQQEEVGKQKIQTPVFNPLASILDKNYPNTIINTFLDTYIRGVTWNQDVLVRSLDQILVKIQKTNNAYVAIERKETDALAWEIHDQFFLKKLPIPCYTFDIASRPLLKELLDIFYLLLGTSPHRTPLLVQQALQPIIQPLQQVIETPMEKRVEQVILYMKQHLKRYSLTTSTTAPPYSQQELLTLLQHQLPWFTINPPLFTTQSCLDQYHHSFWVYDWIDGQERNWYTPATLQQLTQQTIQKVEIFIIDLWQLMEEIATNPVLGDSGQEVPIYRPGQQKSHTERQNEIANQLSGLAKLTARVKLNAFPPNLQSKVCHCCGKPKIATANFCNICGIPIQSEYTITITPNPQRMNPTQLQARIDTITRKNVQDGYVRKRSDVESEIAARQNPLPPAAPPPIPAKPNPAPKQPPTGAEVVPVAASHVAPTQVAPTPVVSPVAPTPRKRVIGTPVTKQCPSCQAQNTPTSLFCNMCGSKL